ncbi:MAG TPA: lamin tail domain-containing protein [Kofleriaceae bacterium]
MLGASSGSATLTATNTQRHLVISQVYGGGGNTGAMLTNDFIEIHNPGSTAVSLAGMSVQYAASTGTSWQVTAFPDMTLPPGGFALVQEAKGNGGATPLPTPDATGTIAMAAASGKVALVAGTTALTGSCPLSSVIDFVGYGSANCFEGSAAAGAAGLSATTAALRGPGITSCADTNDNAVDFGTPGTPNPRNSAGPVVTCP